MTPPAKCTQSANIHEYTPPFGSNRFREMNTEASLWLGQGYARDAHPRILLRPPA
jgi:hypothetical protein